MSIQAVDWVLKHSQAEHAERLVLFALANHASTDESVAFPSVQTLGTEAKLSRRAVQGALARLLEMGEIVETGKTRSGTRCFRLPCIPAQILHPRRIQHKGAQNSTLRGADPAPKSSVNRKEPSGVRAVFDEWVGATGRDAARTRLTPDRRSVIDRAIRSHGLEDCLAAVRNIGRDRWARGDNDRGRRFDDIKHALANGERIERWRDWKAPATKGAGAVPAGGPCRRCKERPRLMGSTHCAPCRDELEAELTGAAA